MKTLLIPSKSDTERNAVALAWKQAGGTVMAVDKFWEKPILPTAASVAIYGNDTFALVLAQVLGLTLLAPEDQLVAQLDWIWTKRKIDILPIRDLATRAFPCFVKPVTPKQFRAQVYDGFAELELQIQGLDPDALVIVAETIAIDAEARAFVLDGGVCDCAIYEGDADVQEAFEAATAFARAHQPLLPSAYVLDLAHARGLGWVVLEFNAAWGAGLNHCAADKVLPCIAAATCD